MSDQDERQPSIDVIVAFDQLGAGLDSIAGVLWGYFHTLTELGFTREEAFALAMAMQERIVPQNSDR